MDAFHFDEKHLSQIPALQVLINLCFTYLTPAEALAARGGKTGQVLLEDILREGGPDKHPIEGHSIHCRGTWFLKSHDIHNAGQVHAFLTGGQHHPGPAPA